MVSMDIDPSLRLGKFPLPIRYTAYTKEDGRENTKADIELLLVKALIDNGAFGLQGLIQIQNDGWVDETTNKHFSTQRQTADSASPELNLIWFRRMKNVLSEIDHALHLIPTQKDVKFLDLGCSPGGFSSYVLDSNSHATGVGVSLPPEDGGHDFCMEEHHLSRFELHLHNLTHFQLGPSPILDKQLHEIPSDIPERGFDLVILDGHHLRTQIGALPWDHDRLLISQLILALRSVKEGGTIIVKLPLPHRLVSARVLIMLNTISSNISVWKPRSMHANRGNCYAVAKDFGIPKIQESDHDDHEPQVIRTRIDFFLKNLQNLWIEMTFGGQEGKGRYMRDADLDFLATIEEIVDYHLEWLIKLGTPLWKVQEISLRKLYLKNKGNYL